MLVFDSPDVQFRTPARHGIRRHHIRRGGLRRYGGSPRIYSGEERFSAPEKAIREGCALAPGKLGPSGSGDKPIGANHQDGMIANLCDEKQGFIATMVLDEEKS